MAPMELQMSQNVRFLVLVGFFSDFCEVGVGHMKSLSEESYCGSLSSIHILYTTTAQFKLLGHYLANVHYISSSTVRR